MALDRQSIEKTDFPTGSNGYDPEAVSAHLSALADEVAEFKSLSRRRTEHMAASASDQVRAIIEAAEASAADIQRAAEAEAAEIREEAHHEAHATRERAEDEVREHVGRVSDVTSAMLTRLEGMESELAELLDTLRGGAGRLDADLRELGSELEQAARAVKPPAPPQFEPDPPPAPEPVEPPSPPQAAAWGSSTSSTADWSGGEPSAPVGEPAATGGWEAPHPAEAASGGSVAGWDSGGSPSGWGSPADEPAEHRPAEPAPAEGLAAAQAHEPPSYEPPAYEPPAYQPPPVEEHPPAAADWSTPAPAAPVEPGAGSFPDAPAAPPGEFATAPYGEGSSASFGDRVSAADTRHEPSADEGDDSEGARLIALNMALNGTPREETARYLTENFQLSDRDGLLDEVYASVEG